MNRDMTRKEFREFLNQQFPASDGAYTKGERGRHGPRTRAYGDHLWHQDREMFENDYREFRAGRLF
jgi:hypothetical protein